MKKIIVIGGGILGASTAYHLARWGAQVTVLDRKDSGQATDAAAGIICPWLSQRRNQDWYRLAKAGARYYPDLIQQLEAEGETETGYAKVGSLSLHVDPEKARKMEERALLRREEAPEIGKVSILDPKITADHFPLLSDQYHSVHVSGAARVDGRSLRDALLRSAQRHGAQLLHEDAKLVFEFNRVSGAAAENKQWAADQVIVCAGAWAQQLMEPLGLEFQVRYQKGQIVHLQLKEQTDTGQWPVVMPPSDQYLLAFESGKMVMGATHENEISGYDTRVTAGGLQEVMNKGLEAAPGLADASLQEVRVGFRPFTPGFLPVLGAVPGWEGLLAANGLGASGLTMGPFIGSQLAKLALGLDTDLDLQPYSLDKVISLKE